MDEVNGVAPRPRHTLPGIYRHYAGDLYEVLMVAEDSNNVVLPPNTAYVVIYVGLELKGAHLGKRVRYRTEHEFHEWVCLEEGPFHGVTRSPWGAAQMADLLEHGFVPRFEYLGEELTAEMIEERAKPEVTKFVPVTGSLVLRADGSLMGQVI